MTKKEIVPLEIDKKMPLDELIESIYPQVLTALADAEGPEQVNEIRLQIGTVVQYINKKMPKEISGRLKRLQYANKGNKVYIEACRKAGDAWISVDKYRGRPVSDPDAKQDDLFLGDKSVQDVTLLTTEEAGFSSRRDALQCVRAAKLHAEDLRIYYSECDTNNRQYTLNGLESVWRELNPSREGDNVPAIDPPFSERLKDIVKKLQVLYNELPAVSDDVKDLLDKAIDQIKDAADILEA